MKKLLAVLVSMTVAMAVLTGCGMTDEEDSNGTENSGTQVEMQEQVTESSTVLSQSEDDNASDIADEAETTDTNDNSEVVVPVEGVYANLDWTEAIEIDTYDGSSGGMLMYSVDNSGDSHEGIYAVEQNEEDLSSTVSYITSDGISASLTYYQPTSSLQDVSSGDTYYLVKDMDKFNRKVEISKCYDHVLCSGGGYYLVSSQVETVTEVVEYVGVFDSDYNWVVPLSDNNPYLNPDGKLVRMGYGYSDYDHFCDYISYKTRYAGEDIFVIGQTTNVSASGNTYESEPDAVMWHVLTDTYVELDVRYYSLQSIRFTDGYYVAAQKDNDKKYVVVINSETGCEMSRPLVNSETGETEDYYLYCGGYKNVGRYSEGVFFAYDGFYDIDFNLVIDLAEYAGLIVNQPYFSNGICTLIAENDIGTQFEAIINIDGEFIQEFTKIEE